ncbi:MAG: hypothetical protein R3B97_14085 [Dehalococcoidia bacterium]|nr:hypothetical protein [Dehalococcoidia bacterium]MCB9486017.1 hypothetical protein [Thermoflexaceae bacterium]
MMYAVGLISVVLIASLQVSVAPLFPISGAEADLGLIAILGTAIIAGPRAAMLVTPALALAIGMAGSRSPGLMLVAYAAILPLAAFVEDLPYPLGRFPRLVFVAVFAGMWGRVLLGIAAMASGGDFAVRALLFQVLLPGLAFDLVLIAAVFAATQAAGIRPRRFTLQRAGWLP